MSVLTETITADGIVTRTLTDDNGTVVATWKATRDPKTGAVTDPPDAPSATDSGRDAALAVLAAQLDAKTADPTDKAFKDAVAALVIDATGP